MRSVKMLSILTFSAVVLAGLPYAAGAVEIAPTGVKTTLTETNLVTANSTNAPYRSLLAYRAGDSTIASDGAVERNISAYQEVSFQRGALWLLARGVVESREAYVDESVRAMEYAFRKQNADGSFTNTLGMTPVQDAEGISFFMQSFARTHDLVGNTTYRARYLPRLAALTPRAQTTMNWLASNKPALLQQANYAPNRLFFDATTFILNGKLLGNSKLTAIGNEFVARGLQAQRADGSFIEGGGYDSSYQATSIGVLTVLLPNIADATLKQQVLAAIQKAIAWEKGRILPTGEVMVDGNARTGLGQEAFMGKIKDVNYAEAAVAMIFGGQVIGDPKATDLGKQVATYVAHLKGN